MKSLNRKQTDKPTICQAFNQPNSNSNTLDDHGNRQDDKSSHHDLDHDHDARSSAASSPILQDSRFDDNQNGGGGGNGGLTPMSLPISKSPQEDNNNHLGALPHPTAFPLGLPFHHPMQERVGGYRFAEDLPLGGSMAGRLGDSLIPKSDPMEAKLQEMLRYNMDKYANQNLDTLHISRRVRELLSVHNIGQRLFAKYVLGLSQGTVSELLSKPKPWDKLTEKGRDSYRKMHAWACDDNAVLLLKSLIPKKGEWFGFFCACDDFQVFFSRSWENISIVFIGRYRYFVCWSLFTLNIERLAEYMTFVRIWLEKSRSTHLNIRWFAVGVMTLNLLSWD